MEKIMGNAQNILILMAKYPDPGRVKTRLARSEGEKRAADLCRKMTEIVVARTRSDGGDYNRVLFFHPPEAAGKFRRWFGFFRQRPQSGRDLGERMRKAFEETLSEAQRVVMIGSDCVDLDSDLVRDAFRRLRTADLVLGPAKDGGYYLIGLSRVHPELFEGIAWGTAAVFSETCRRAGILGLKTSFLPEREDIDTEKQLWRLGET